jgi:RNA polymerase sigma-70 factor, ECF subfamily
MDQIVGNIWRSVHSSEGGSRMNSETATYLRDALAGRLEVRDVGDCSSAAPLDFPDTVKTPVGALQDSAGTVTPICELSDTLLLEQVRQGDKEALGLLFRRHARAVRSVAYRILRNEAEADDLVQEVFLFIFRKAALFDAAKGAARSWIFQVAYHRAFDKRRYLSSRHFYTSQDLDETGRSLVDSRDALPFHELSMEGILGKQLTARFNARLTPEQRETIRLFFFEGYALKEIAQLTGRPLANVRSHYYRGLARLRKYVLPEQLRAK